MPHALRLILFATTFLALTARNARAGDWPQWRGPDRTARSTETGLLKKWPQAGPRVAWQIENAGIGYASMAVANGRVITQGDLDGVEHILAFSEKDGSLLWAVQPAPVAKALDSRIEGQFARLDRNKNGKLEQAEALAGIGWNFSRYDKPSPGNVEKLAAARTADLIAAYDKDGDRQLSGAEIPRAMSRELQRIDRPDPSADNEKLAARRTGALLAEADKDKDGQVDRRESRGTPLQFLFNRMDKRKPGERRGDGLLTAAEIKEYFLKREPGRDGIVTSRELAEYFAKTFPGRDGILTKTELRGFYGGYRNSYGDGPRGTPTVDGDRIYAEGGNGDLTCLEAATGNTIWHVNLAQNLGGGRPGWGYSESPLIAGDWVIVTPGGRNGTLAALDKHNGQVVWRSTGVSQGAQYSSPVLATLSGVKQLVQFARTSAFGVELQTGKLLWTYSAANNGTANVATPIVTGEHVLVSSGYGKGSGMVKITGSGTGQRAEQVYFQKSLSNHHGGLVKVGDYVYGFGRGLMCMNFKTGEIAWRARSVGKGSLIYADGMLYCLGERYEVALVEASPQEYRERGRFRIERADRPSWAHPVVANGRLFIRNQNKLVAYDVKAR